MAINTSLYNETLLLAICVGNPSATFNPFEQQKCKRVVHRYDDALQAFTVSLKNLLSKSSVVGDLRRHDTHVMSL